ncbi:MAG: hypothetical protein AAFN30_05755 [Actinomycetota bacterium]
MRNIVMCYEHPGFAGMFNDDVPSQFLTSSVVSLQPVEVAEVVSNHARQTTKITAAPEALPKKPKVSWVATSQWCCQIL